MIPDGVFPAVALSGGLGTLAVREGDPRFPGWLVVYRFPVTDSTNFTELARFPLPAGSPCFPGLYVLDGLTWLAYHDGQQQRLHVLTTGRGVLAVAGLSNPSAFGAGYFAWTEPWSPYQVHRLNLWTAEVDQSRLGAPTGLSRILDDGRVVTIDEDRHALPGATIPAFAGPLAVGEGPAGGVVWSHTSGARGVLWPGRDSFTPKCAADGDILAITTAGPDVRLFCGTLAQLQRVPGPFHQETPMSVPDQAAFVASFLGPRLRWFQGDEPRTVAHSFAQLNALVTEMAKTDPNWALLEKTAGNQVRDRAADIALYRISAHEAQVVDVIGDAEGHDGPPRPGWSLKDIRPISQWKPPYPDVTPPVDPPPAQPPTQPPAPAVDLAPIVARIEKLEAALKTVAGDLQILASRPAPAVDLDAALAGYEVRGKTRVSGWHQHAVKLAIARKEP